MKLIDFIKANKVNMDEQLWIAVFGCAVLLNDFGCTMDEKIFLSKTGQHSFANEFNLSGQPSLKEKLKEDNRKNKTIIEMLVFETPGVEQYFKHFNAIKQIYEHQSQEVALLNKKKISNLKPGISPTKLELTSSLLHMFVNRFFQTKNRFYEFLIYDYLNKTYQSFLSKSKNTTREIVS